MNNKFLSSVFLAAMLAAVSACNSDEGNEFVGSWKERGPTQMRISRDGSKLRVDLCVNFQGTISREIGLGELEGSTLVLNDRLMWVKNLELDPASEGTVLIAGDRKLDKVEEMRWYCD
nr:hypothetical protein [uncultured Shimia sp.]